MATRYRVVSDEGRAKVEVDDWELFDWLDDILSQAGYEYELLTERDVGGSTVFTMSFAESVSPRELREVLASVPEEEVERVWQLNNS